MGALSIQSSFFADRLRAKGVPLGNWLGSAGWGVVFLHAENPKRVIKVTQMLREAEAALWIRSAQRGFHEPVHPCLPIIYGWRQDFDKDLRHPKDSHTNFWVIEREELADLSMPQVIGLPPPPNTRETLFWERILDSILEATQHATAMQHTDPERRARARMDQMLGIMEVKTWEEVETAYEAEMAEKLGVMIQTVRRSFGAEMRRLAEFAGWCVKANKILGDMGRWNWGVRRNGALVVRDLGGFLDWKYRHGPFEGLGAWTPKVIKGEKPGPVKPYREDWRREGRQMLPRAGFGLKYQEIPSRDPWAYGAGFVDALHGKRMIEAYIGSAYGAGFAHGIRVRMGEEALPRWIVPQSEYPYAGSRGSSHSGGRGMRPSHPPRVSGPRMTVRQVLRHFASKNTPAHSSGAVWTDGTTLYSYKQAIAQKFDLDRRFVKMDTRRFSKTTSAHQRLAQYELEIVGWKVAYGDLPKL